ncbi:hypothetical protein ABZ478_13645 [Streptomyces sp. NPDC005706]|uniref:hypothetical protein n=1 Tax=Streptomyces sp. NPDC005706 TaxID=3157169 RepID=UPI00340BED99
MEELRAALAAHGITLPSLRVDLPSFAATYRPPAGLVALVRHRACRQRDPACGGGHSGPRSGGPGER